MATKDVSDLMVCRAYAESNKVTHERWPYDFLMEWTGQPQKVCFRAMERAHARNLVDYGVSIRSGWLTENGKLLLAGDDVNAQ